MSLSAHDQRVLDVMEHRLSDAAPELASLLAGFTRLAAGEEMPVRERIRAGWQRLTWDRAWLLLGVLISLALITMAVAAGGSGGKQACSAWVTACAGPAAARSAVHQTG